MATEIKGLNRIENEEARALAEAALVMGAALRKVSSTLDRYGRTHGLADDLHSLIGAIGLASMMAMDDAGIHDIDATEDVYHAAIEEEIQIRRAKKGKE